VKIFSISRGIETGLSARPLNCLGLRNEYRPLCSACEVEENSEKPFRISFLAGAATAGGAAGSEGKDGRTG